MTTTLEPCTTRRAAGWPAALVAGVGLACLVAAAVARM